MHIVVPHKLSQAAAVARVKEGIDKGRAQIAGHATITEERWDGNTLTFGVELQGKPVSGTLAVEDTQYVLDAKLPLMWRLFEKRIESEISAQVQKML